MHVHSSTIQAQLELSTQRKGKVPKLPKIKQWEGIKYKPKSQTFIILSANEGIKRIHNIPVPSFLRSLIDQE